MIEKIDDGEACDVAPAGQKVCTISYIPGSNVAMASASARHSRGTSWARYFAGVLLVKRGDIGTGLEHMRAAFARIPQNALTLLYTLFLAEIAIGRADRARCHGSWEHPQALHACSMIKVGSPMRAAFCSRCTIVSARALKLPS
jgi:hypothetical protein